MFVKAFWLRAGDERYGWPDYAHAYVWVAPVLMNPKRCEEIEPFLARVRDVTQTGRGGDPHERRNALRRSCSPSSTCKLAEPRHDRPSVSPPAPALNDRQRAYLLAIFDTD